MSVERNSNNKSSFCKWINVSTLTCSAEDYGHIKCFTRHVNEDSQTLLNSQINQNLGTTKTNVWIILYC